MPAPNAISSDKLLKLIGTPRCPTLIDVRTLDDFETEPRLIPGSLHLGSDDLTSLEKLDTPGPAVLICYAGQKRAQGAAAWLRQAGKPAEYLEGGFDAWRGSNLPTVDATKLPPRDSAGQTVWVTRSRPKIDRIACPWLIRRFIDPNARFLFVSPAEVTAVAGLYAGAPFDIEGVFWSHRGEKCSFDVMLDEFGLDLEPLRRLATIVRGADTARLDLAPEAAGLLAASLGLSRMYSDDLEQLDAGMALYDAFYRWARDATDEIHNWPAAKPRP